MFSGVYFWLLFRTTPPTKTNTPPEENTHLGWRVYSQINGRNALGPFPSSFLYKWCVFVKPRQWGFLPLEDMILYGQAIHHVRHLLPELTEGRRSHGDSWHKV